MNYFKFFKDSLLTLSIINLWMCAINYNEEPYSAMTIITGIIGLICVMVFFLLSIIINFGEGDKND